MNKIIKWMSILCWIVLVKSVFASDIKITDSKVTAATVFQRQAMVTRNIEVEFQSGKSRIIVSELPTEFYDETVRVSGSSFQDVKILDVKVDIIHTAVVQGKPEQEIRKEMDALQAKDRIAEDQLAVLHEQKSFIESIKAESAKDMNQKVVSGTPSIQSWQAMLNFFGSNLTDIHQKIRDQEAIRDKILKEIAALNRTVSDAQMNMRRSYKEIVVSIESASSGKGTFEISYLVNDARWNPLYDARVSGDEKQVEMVYYGMVSQNTGEDWDNVKLALSTARPLSTKNQPSLKPWFLKETRQVIRRDMTSSIASVSADEIEALPVITSRDDRSLPQGYGRITGTVRDSRTNTLLIGANVQVMRTALGAATSPNGRFTIHNVPAGSYQIRVSMMGYRGLNLTVDIASQKEIHIPFTLIPLPLEGEAVTVKVKGLQPGVVGGRSKKRIDPVTTKSEEIRTASVFHIPVSSDIPSDAEPHKVTIAIESLDMQFEYTTIPKLSSKVYLKGKAANETKYPFLAGAVNTFFDRDFVNKSSIPYTVTSDTLELTLGIDEGIEVERRLINRFVESKGLLGRDQRVTMEYEFILQNHKSTKERIVLQDHIPISQHEKVEVKLLIPDEKEVAIDMQKRLTWEVTLKPGEKKILPFKYSVKYPNHMNFKVQ
ncbi:mucoidy inhibitor MuiA family protein [candidate division KSB1 bacterium]|nr:mucoidy inhibitor MuiA family protein [candidate division KSB1 bacterium]